MAKIERLPSGTYRTRLYLGKDETGKKIYKSLTAPTKQELRAAARQYEAEHRSPTGITVKQAVAGYIESASAQLSPATVRGYKACQAAINRYPDFAGLKLDMVGKRDVQRLIDSFSVEMVKKGRGTHKISPKTVRERYNLLMAVLKRYDIRIDGIKLPAKVRHEISVPDDDRMKEILTAAKGTDLEIPILLAAIGGLRRGEICALHPEDLDGDVLHVSRDMVLDPDRRWVVKAPKTYNSDRYVELPHQLAQMLRERWLPDINPNALTNRHNRFLKSHGIEHFRFHDYRHHMVSALHAAGISDAYIMQRGGWSTDHVMKSVYRHTLANHDRDAVIAANAHFEELL
jgi:integrase